ncbi:AMP-binding protein [Conexibacter stalactiti]|uniref:AMP-binding protein n=1 Tax=Conexibacter stalactiti TaxID=1940611 RepID=A0ABU4HKB2_9ACTN|nr:AMP-binding protein [Conexibacter stalactiti]MDW5593763.1 AMP-binding protein [Conexibacter stalactiti]MEC5034405.1 AMP-binding protein [Conexibacter stalactiti]
MPERFPPIGDLLTALAATRPDDPAVTCGDESVTFAQLESRANRLARAYAELGVREGDFVSVGLPNGVELYAASYAIWKLGAVPQPLSYRLPARELEQVIAVADPSLIVGFGEEVAAGRAAVPAGFEPAATLSDGPLESRVSPAWKAPTSGGSTGVPKLIVSGSSGAFDVDAAAAGFGMRRGQVQLVPGPLYHNAPFAWSMLGSHVGQHVVVLPRFDAEAALAAIERHRVGWLSLVPTMMQRMLKVLDDRPGVYDLSSLDLIYHTGAPCPPWLKERWIDLVGGERLVEGYGGTEAIAFTVIDGTEWLEHRGSVGRVVAGEMRVVDADGRELPAGEVGEIFLRRPAGTPPTYHYVGAEPRVLDGGWESLGDMGRFDDDGYLYLSDRQLDMIVSGAANVYPAEVEAAVLEHPQVLTAAVVGLPDDDLGQRVHAVVQAEGALEEEALRAFVSERLVRYKVPRSFRFVDEPLRDEAGKVRRAAVREQELAWTSTHKGSR